MRNFRLIFLFVAANFAFATPAQFELRGSFKSIYDYQRLNQTNIFTTNDEFASEQRLRLQAEITHPVVRVEVADELSFGYSTALSSAIPIPNLNPGSWWNTTTNILTNSTTIFTNRIDRAYLSLILGDSELRVGKQIVDEGVGHIFEAVSQVPRYPFVYVDQEYPVTQDAASLIWKGPFTLEIRYLPKIPGQYEDNIHLRAKGSKAGNDIALTAGRTYDKPYAGLEAAGNLGDSLVRGEIVGYEWNGQTAVQALVGFDRTFSASFSAQVEFFYNGFGTDGSYQLTPLVHPSAPYRGKWYFGTVLAWEISPRWKANFIGIVNLRDPSALLQLTLDFSIADNLDLLLGQYLLVATQIGSEFGGALPIPNLPGMTLGLPNISYFQLRWYF